MLFSPLHACNRSCREYIDEFFKVYFNSFFHLHHIQIEFDQMLNVLVIFWCKVKFGQFSSYWDFKKSHFYFQGTVTITGNARFSLCVIEIVIRSGFQSGGENFTVKWSQYPWLRLYFMMGLKLVKTQMMVFFTAKNILTVIVYGYRNIWNPLTTTITSNCQTFKMCFQTKRLKYLWHKCESDLLYNKASDFIRWVLIDKWLK